MRVNGIESTDALATAGPADRVRAHTPAALNQRVDAETQHCLESLAGADPLEIAAHIDALDREWDVERYLQTNASIVSLAGVVLGAAVDRRFLVLPATVFTFFFQHAVQGWCPPLPVFRRLGIRTQAEIEEERYALKALRGDFEGTAGSGGSRIKEALAAVEQ